MTDETNPPAGEPPEPERQAADPDAGAKSALQAERKARKEAERQAREALERAAALERKELLRTVATEKGLNDAQAAFLTGETAEELSASADALTAAFAREESPAPGRRPTERLTPGAIPADGDGPNVAAVADRVMKL